MALQRDTRYPNRWDNATSEYPQGKFKNRTTSTAEDGSYLERDWANDWAGFFGRLMTVAGFTANGSVDNALSSQLYDALLECVRKATPGWIKTWQQDNNDTTGGVMAFAHGSIPNGWLPCNGQAVSRTDYSRLFDKIGTTYGAGDGSTTFNLPDMRGEFIRGWDNGRGVDIGRTLGSAQGDLFKSHDHGGNTGTAGEHRHSTALYSGVGGGVRPEPFEGTTGGGSQTGFAGDHNHTIPASGGSETRPRNIAFMFCIKT